jgi:hypothetical protein
MSEREVTLDAHGLRIDGEPTPLVAGSLEFWRVISLTWRRSLELMRDAGLRQVSTFVCWDFHEVERGKFDFDGSTHPSRDFAGFIDLCAELGLDVLLRVGPIIDAEWPSRGPAVDVGTLQRTDPTYRARTEQYLDALLEHVRPRLATNGGPIILVGLDNEPYFPYVTDDDSDPSAGSTHVPYVPEELLVGYRRWLSDRYGENGALGAAWGRSVTPAEVQVPDFRSDSERAVLDSFEYGSDVIAETYGWMLAFCRERGLDVPAYSNMKPLSHHIEWSKVEQIVDAHGIGVFTADMVPYEQALVLSWYVRLERAVARFPWAAEFQSFAPMGQEAVFGLLSDEHQRYMTQLTMALGLRGLSYYVFVERDDGYGAPISPLGKVRPRLARVAEAVRMARAVRADAQVAEVDLQWSLDHHRLAIAERFPSWHQLHHVWTGVDQRQELPGWWDVFRDLHAQDVDFEITPLHRPHADRLLVYAGPDAVSAAQFEPVVDAVEQGAHLAARALPTTALDGRHDELRALGERLVATGRVHLGERLDAAALLAELGRTTPVTAGRSGLWTTAYEGEDAWWLFVTNPSEADVVADVTLGGRFAQAIEGRTGTDPVTGETATAVDAGLVGTGVHVAPKQVRAMRFEKEDR